MDDNDAIAALVSDLRWQIDQLKARSIKDKAGNPYNPSYYKRGLQNALDKGERAVADFVLGYVRRAPSDGYQKLEDADSLDLACEALVADETKPYAHLFSDEDRALARERLAPFLERIRKGKEEMRGRIERRTSEMPDDPGELREMAGRTTDPEESAAIALALLRLVPDDVPAMNRLGRAYDALGEVDEAIACFERVLAIEPGNPIASKRLREAQRRAASSIPG